MIEFIINNAPLIGGIGVIFSLLVKIVAMYQATEIEKQLENNTQRTIRDIKNIGISFICFWIAFFGLYMLFNQDKNTINFSVNDLNYHISGNISNKNTQPVIFTVNKSEQTIELKKQKYNLAIDQKLVGGEKYTLTDKNHKEILNGVVPTKRAIDKENINYLIYFSLVVLLLSGYIYYVIKYTGYKKKLIFKKDKKTYVILKSIDKNNLLLQKIEKNKDNLYILKNIYSILEKNELNNKDLEYENSEDMRRRKQISAYNSWQDLNWKKVALLIIVIIGMFIFIAVYSWLSDLGFKWGVGIIIIVIIYIVCTFWYQKSLYKKGEVIVTEDKRSNK